MVCRDKFISDVPQQIYMIVEIIIKAAGNNPSSPCYSGNELPTRGTLYKLVLTFTSFCSLSYKYTLIAFIYIDQVFRVGVFHDKGTITILTSLQNPKIPANQVTVTQMWDSGADYMRAT